MAYNTKWTIEKIKIGFKSFYNEFGHYPTAYEIDRYAKLPSSRQIQRVFGGLVEIRKMLSLKETDFTKGEFSSKRALKITRKASTANIEVYSYLVKTFGVDYVQKDYNLGDDKRNRIDFHVINKKGDFLIDIFVPSNTRTLIGCLNSKLKTYGELNIDLPIIFLMMNDSITSQKLGDIVSNKKSKLRHRQQVMTFEDLKSYCNSIK